MRNNEMEAEACWCDYDPPEFFRLEKRTARKLHECCECKEQIDVGQRYEHIIGKWDGWIGSYNTCLPCAQLREDFCSPYTMLRDTLWEMLETDYITGASACDDEETD